MLRIGNGYDVHVLSKDRRLVIGGVDIPYSSGLLGHSDADVLVHAIIDSLLGAAALGDIGALFPDSDDSFLDADSIVLLEKVAELLSQKGYCIVNIDSIVVAQKPKLSGYIDMMRKKISDACKIETDCVSVKATTEEKLGFTGRQEGISAHAICLINSK